MFAAVAYGQTWLRTGSRIWIWFKLNFVDCIPVLPGQRELLKQESYILLSHRAAMIYCDSCVALQFATASSQVTQKYGV